MKVWAKSDTHPEGKFLVVRRDGTIPSWPHFVMGARDPCVPAALRAYAMAASNRHMDDDYIRSIMDLADDFERYSEEYGESDPDAPPHRFDDKTVVDLMGNRIGEATVHLKRDVGFRIQTKFGSPK